MRTSRIASAAILALAGLAYGATLQPTQTVAIADAASYEGQAVVVQGVAWPGPVLRNGTAQLPVALRPGETLAPGTAATLTGQLDLVAGRLTLEDARVLDQRPGPPPSHSVAELATSPWDFVGQRVATEGSVANGYLASGAHRIRLGDGAWPKTAAAIRVDGELRYDAACACYRIDAWQVRPWTP